MKTLPKFPKFAIIQLKAYLRILSYITCQIVARVLMFTGTMKRPF